MVVYEKEMCSSSTRVVLIVIALSSLHLTLTIADNGELEQTFVLYRLSQYRPIRFKARKGLQLKCAGRKGTPRPGQRRRADRAPPRSPPNPRILSCANRSLSLQSTKSSRLESTPFALLMLTSSSRP